MTAAMAGFAVEDAFIKTAAQSLPVGEVTAVMGLAGILVFSALSLRRGEMPLPRAAFTRVMAVRSAFELVGRLFFALAIALTPLTTTSAILQATPIFVVMGAAWLFGEKVGALRWALVVLGFLGVLIVIRPDQFDPMSIFAVLGMLGFAGRDLATRAAPLALSNAQLGVAGFAVLGGSGLVLLAFGPAPVWPEGAVVWAALAGAAGFGILGYALLTAAMRKGEVSFVTPFRYSRLLFALILGVLWFGERPDAATLAGAALIVGCGVVILGQSGRKTGANR